MALPFRVWTSTRDRWADAASVVHVITGEGTGSTGAPVLSELVRNMLDDDSADQVDECAGMLGGSGWVIRVK